MKLFIVLFAVVGVLFSTTIMTAQDAPPATETVQQQEQPISIDISAIFASTAALAAFAMAATAFLKAHIFAWLDGWKTILANLVVCVVVSLIGMWAGFLKLPVQGALAFAFAAFVISVGGAKFVFQAASKAVTPSS